MRKQLALLGLSFGVASVIPLFSAIAQESVVIKTIPVKAPSPVVSNLPRRPVRPTVPVAPTTPVPSPRPTQTSAQPPLKLFPIGVDCQPAHGCLGWDEQIFGGGVTKRGDRQALIRSINHSLNYLSKPSAKAAYVNYPVKGVTHSRVVRSLRRFRDLVSRSKSPAELQRAVRREFNFYKSIGNDGKGTVKYTAYYEPVYTASRRRTAEYRYPIYSLPSDFKSWSKPHPTRLELEGVDGKLGNKSRLKGRELLWFRTRMDAYMIHIQGSARIKLTDGGTTSVGFAGATDYPWTSIGGELAKDGKLPLSGLTMPVLLKYFKDNPEEMNNYLPRWERFVFFREKNGAPAKGSIGVPVTPERSIATDKSLMPRGALALVHTRLPFPDQNGRLVYRTVSRFVLDQDTGSAIKTPGRVDYFMGTGKLAGDRAGVTGGSGTLYYLLLKK